MRIRASKKVIKCVFTHNMFNNFIFCSSVCIVHTLCKITIHNVCHNGATAVDPDSRQVPNVLVGVVTL